VITDQGTIRHQIVVDLTPTQAWDRFTAHMTDWWPSAHHIGSAPIEEIVIEPLQGGRWYTRHTDGTETSTGVVREWQPPEVLVLTWQITADWKFDPDFVTTVSVRLTAQGDDRTLLELEHAGFEAYGPEADAMRTMFDSPGAWVATLAAYSGVSVEDVSA
jgi:uncharacterized protein YndB with AHSA1/START domain